MAPSPESLAPPLAPAPELVSPEQMHLHSRSIRAGYRPERLFGAHALVIGAGAVGQNLLQNLALAGIGQILLADFDVFEPHNATRSPLYPTPEEAKQWGLGKAEVVAHKLRRLMTAPEPSVHYAAVPIQALGDAPFRWADLVFSAVDTPAARAHLADRCRLHGKPLFEVGFAGAEINLAVYGPDPDEPCWRCGNDVETGAFSCTRYALEAEASGIIPAIQNAAAVLAALQAEAGILWLHGERALRGKVVYGDVRSMTLRTAILSVDPECPGVHRTPPLAGELSLAGGATVAELRDAVREKVGPAEVRLPATLVLRANCTNSVCGALATVHRPAWRWLMDPRCEVCGGVFPRAAEGQGPAGLLTLDTETPEHWAEVSDLACAEAGFPTGTTIEVWPAGQNKPLLLSMPGTIADLVSAVG